MNGARPRRRLRRGWRLQSEPDGPRVGIVGGGIAGLSAAFELERARRRGSRVRWTLIEASHRFGGIVDTVRRDGFVVECGPDGWVSDKRAARTLAEDLGLGADLVHSLDAGRRTYLYANGGLVPMPDGLRMMVPTDMAAVEQSPLFSAEAKRAFREEPGRAAELIASAPAEDESIASFVERHFGREVLDRVGAPLLSGVFGGDVRQLSVRAVMAPFVALEREFGSLIVGMARRPPSSEAIFTSLAGGMGRLTESLVQDLPPDDLVLGAEVRELRRSAEGWTVVLRTAVSVEQHEFDEIVLATPADVTERLLRPVAPLAADLLPTEASSAISVALAFQNAALALPPGFGLLVPPGGERSLLACTFAEQKYPHRVPPGGQLLRAFFGAGSAERLAGASEADLVVLARRELRDILGITAEPAFTVVRRWPRSLPQYAVGHLDRVRRLFSLVADQLPGLTLLGNSYLGVGVPDLVRDARAAAHRIAFREAV